MRFLKSYVKLNKMIANEEILSDQQKSALKIVDKLLISPDSDLLHTPVTSNYYIKHKDVLIKISGSRIQMHYTGGHFYDIEIPLKCADDLQAFLKKQIEIKGSEIEACIQNQNKIELDSILNSIE